MRVLETLCQFSDLAHIVMQRIDDDRQIRFRQAFKAIQSGQSISGKGGVLAPFIKQLTEAALSAESDSHLADDVVPDRKYGKSSKTLKTSAGKIGSDTPHDRAGTFELQFVKKLQSSVSDKIETKVLSIYDCGLSYSGISEQEHEIYSISMPKAATNTVTDKAIEDELEQTWEDQYPVVIQSWHRKWDNLSVYSRYPEPKQKFIYTTNFIGAEPRQFRKPTKTKSGFASDNSLFKLSYLRIQNASKKWIMPIHNWNLALSQLAIFLKVCLMKHWIYDWHSKSGAFQVTQNLAWSL